MRRLALLLAVLVLGACSSTWVAPYATDRDEYVLSEPGSSAPLAIAHLAPEPFVMAYDAPEDVRIRLRLELENPGPHELHLSRESLRLLDGKGEPLVLERVEPEPSYPGATVPPHAARAFTISFAFPAGVPPRRWRYESLVLSWTVAQGGRSAREWARLRSTWYEEPAR